MKQVLRQKVITTFAQKFLPVRLGIDLLLPRGKVVGQYGSTFCLLFTVGLCAVKLWDGGDIQGTSARSGGPPAI